MPDLALGANPSLAQRGASVMAHFIGGGGQSTTYFIAFALALGFQITINEFVAFRPDVSTVETPLFGDEWMFSWGIVVVANTGTLSTAVLLSEIAAMAPANTFVFLD